MCFSLDFENNRPPASCGFDLSTGEDKFCCAAQDFESKKIIQPQDPLYTQKNGKAYPCIDFTTYCKQWADDYPQNCYPNYNNESDLMNRYPFMREVCQKSCQEIADKDGKVFRANKCKNVSKYLTYGFIVFTLIPMGYFPTGSVEGEKI